jgi:HlyD family secretion protein
LSSLSFSLAAERAKRLAQGARESIATAVLRATGSARPWLRREAWTLENLRRVADGLRQDRKRAARWLLGAFALVLLLFIGLSGGDGPPGVATAVVQEGPFEVAIVEGGTLQALRSVTYASTIQSNQAKIVALAQEGKMVKKGDLLILFDAAPFEEDIRRNQALLAQAEADQQKAQQDLKLQTIQNQEDLVAAHLKVERSDLELRDIQEGKGKLKEEEAVAAVANAERELQKAKTAHADLRPLLAEGFITRAELERAEQQVARAEEDLKLAERRRDAFLGYGRPLELSQARADASQSKETLRQLESAASYRIEQKKAAVLSAESRIAEAASKLELARQQLARTEVRADVEGIVVYKDVFFGSEQRKPQVGDQVWANQPLLILPDISKMVVETKVRETDIHKVEQNQKVQVRVEAYPDLKLTGAVTLVGTLAQEERERRGTKFFGVTIQVAESEPRLRPGMSARVDIQVQERTKAVYVPLEAVFEKDGRSFCYVARGRRATPREVVLGPSNQDFVVVEKGLRRGERVCLRDPGAPPSDLGNLTAQQ